MKEKSNYKSNKKGDHKIGLLAASSLVVGNMIGSGIFLLPAALAIYGGISLFGWLFTTIGAVFLSLVFARLSRIVKNPGGPYTYSKEGFGKFAGFLVAWGYWVSIWCGNAAIAVAGTGYLGAIFPAIKESKTLSAIISVSAIWVFSLINTGRLKNIAGVQVVTTLVKILPIVIIGSLGFLHFNPEYFKPLNLSSFSSFEAISATAALTLWAFLGLESATIPSNRVKNPDKTIPIATIAGTIFAAIIFIGSTIAVMGIVDPETLKISQSPFADAAIKIWGKKAGFLFALAAVISCYGALNGWILLQGQIPLAAAQDDLFPKIFKRLSPSGAPVFGIIISSILASILVGVNYTKGLIGMFTFIIMLSTLTVLLPYVLTSLSEILIYIKKKIPAKPGALRNALLIGLPAFVYSIWAVVGLGLEIIAWGTVLISAGVPIYLLMIYKKRKK